MVSDRYSTLSLKYEYDEGATWIKCILEMQYWQRNEKVI